MHQLLQLHQLHQSVVEACASATWLILCRQVVWTLRKGQQQNVHAQTRKTEGYTQSRSTTQLRTTQQAVVIPCKTHAVSYQLYRLVWCWTMRRTVASCCSCLVTGNMALRIVPYFRNGVEVVGMRFAGLTGFVREGEQINQYPVCCKNVQTFRVLTLSVTCLALQRELQVLDVHSCLLLHSVVESVL